MAMDGACYWILDQRLDVYKGVNRGVMHCKWVLNLFLGFPCFEGLEFMSRERKKKGYICQTPRDPTNCCANVAGRCDCPLLKPNILTSVDSNPIIRKRMIFKTSLPSTPLACSAEPPCRYCFII